MSLYFIEPRVYNFMVKNFSAGLKSGSDEVVVVVVDDKSVHKRRWPWKRELYADIFEYLSVYAKPKIIGFDAIFAAADKEHPASDVKFFKTINKIDNLVVAFSPVYKEYESQNSSYAARFDDKFGINVTDRRKKKYPPAYKSTLPFLTQYFDVIKYCGSVQTIIIRDGYLWVSDQIISVGDKFYPSLAMRMYLLMNDTGDITLYDNAVVVEKTGLKIPTLNNRMGIQSFIRYYKRQADSSYTHKHYSAVDLVDSLENLKHGKKPVIDPAEFKDKVVLVGVNAFAVGLGAEDTLRTPIQEQHPGVDIQATFTDNLIHNEFIRQSSLWQDIVLMVIISVVTFVLISRLSFMRSLIILAGFGALYYGLAVLFFMHNIAVSVLTPLLILLVTMIFAYSYKFITENRHKEKIKNAMGKYLSQDIMKNVVQNIDDIKLGGKRAHVTVLFSDIRGFTSMSEKMSAEEVSAILNEYFSEMEPIITKYNGVINKFIGDAIMAIFGEPIQDIQHPFNAVKCAHAMLKKVGALQSKWLDEGKPKIEIGIGINTGEAFVGNVGSENRLEYTVIGDMVNIASRIESYNKVYKTNFLISASTYSYVSSIVDVIKINEVTIRGKAKKMDIYEVLRVG